MERSLKDLRIIKCSPGLTASDRLSVEVAGPLRILAGRREVYRGRLRPSDREVVVKCYLPHAKQTRDWKQEWSRLGELESKGLPVPKPLAVGKTADGIVCVIMEYIQNALTLGAFLKSSNDVERCRVMQGLVCLVDQLHAAGARQTDQHIDNWAVADGMLYVLDAGTYRFSKGPLSSRARVLDLAAICATLPPASEKLFREALRLSYWTNAAEAARVDLIGLELNRAIERIQQTRARRYFKKTRRDCSEFGRIREGAWSGMYSKQSDPALVECFFKNPDAWMAEGRRLKSGNTCTVQHISLGEQSYVLKRYNRKTWWIRLRRSLSASRACRSWSNGWLLNLCHIPTARPVAFAEERGFPRGMSYLLMEAIDGELLPDYVEQHAGNVERMKTLVEQAGRIWDLLGRIRAVHGDLKATNWMVDEAGQVFLFDLDSFCCGLTQAAFRRGRNKDMRRFLKNWAANPLIADSFRRRMETKKGAAQ